MELNLSLRYAHVATLIYCHVFLSLSYGVTSLSTSDFFLDLLIDFRLLPRLFDFFRLPTFSFSFRHFLRLFTRW